MMHNTGIKSGSAETATGALSVTGPQPVWMTLDEARERAFTGEVVFEVDPEVLAYLDNGVVYYAERVSDAPLGRRLLDAGVVDTSQLERGTVRVGDVEHLGRLFDREPSVDRDAVLVVTETATEDLIAELANAAVATVRVTAYRHHPSGIHRWFVAQLDSPSALRPVGSSNQLDSGAIEELPHLSVVTDDELTIEWDDIDDMVLTSAPETTADDFESAFGDQIVDAAGPTEDVSTPMADDAELVEIDFGSGDVDAGDTEVAEEPAAEASDGDFEFEVTWPDGTADLVETEAPTRSEFDTPIISDEPVITETDDGALHFEMPDLEMDDDGVSEEVPDDVADAVRRAIAAIESASVEPSGVSAEEIAVDEPAAVDAFDTDLDVAPDLHLDVAADIDLDVAADEEWSAASEITTQVEAIAATSPSEVLEPAPALEPPAPAGMGAFAPPTMDMRAEVVYARAEQATDDPASLDPPELSAEPSLPAPGVAFVDEADEPDEADENPGNERTSALRRLIGGLRRKDH